MSYYTYARIVESALECKKSVESSKSLGVDAPWGYYFAKAIITPKINITHIEHRDAQNSQGDNVNFNIVKYHYMDMARRLVNYVETNHQMPNYVGYNNNQYNIKVEDYVYMFARILVWYYQHGSLPNYATVNSSKVNKWYRKTNTNVNKTRYPFKDSLEADEEEKYAYSMNVASMRNPNTPILNDWSNTGNAVSSSEKFTSSKYTVKGSKVTEPEGLAFADFGLDIPNDAYITMLRFEVKIKIDNSSTKVKSPTGFFMVYHGNGSVQQQRTTGQDGWYSGTYRDYAILDLSTSWQVMTYTIYEKDWNERRFPSKSLNEVAMGIDLVFEQPSKITQDTGVQIAWVRAVVDYIRPNYRITYNPPTTIEEPLEMLVDEQYCVNINFENTTKGKGGEQEVTIELPWGTELISYEPSTADVTEVNSYTYTWKVNGDSLAKDHIKLCLNSEVLGFRTINTIVDNVAFPYYIYPFTADQVDFGDLSIVGTAVQKGEPSCFNFNAKAISEDETISYTVVVDGENQTDWSKISQAVLDYYNNPNQGNCIVTGDDGTLGWQLNQESVAQGVSIDWENTDNNTITFNIPQEVEVDIKWSACFIPLTTGENTLYVINGDTGSSYTYEYDSLDPNVRVVTPAFDDTRWNEHRLLTKINNGAYYIPMSVKRTDRLMIQKECTLKAHLWKDVAYIGCVPLEQGHYDPKHQTTNKGITETHKNITYMGKKMEVSEDTTLKIKGHPYDWTTWKGLVELDKPIPVNTVPKLFEGDVLAHRGWAEITGIKNVTKTNPHWYDGEIELDYLTHNIHSRFVIQRGGKSFDVKETNLVASVLNSGEEFALYTYINEDGETVTNSSGYFIVDTDGAYIYDEDMSEESRTLVALDNKQYVNIRSEKPFSGNATVKMRWHTTKISEDKENKIDREISIVDENDRVIFKYTYHDFEYNPNNEYYSCMVKAEKLVDNVWTEIINKKLYLAVDVESLQLTLDENGNVVQESEPNYDELIPTGDEEEYEIYEFNDFTYGSSVTFSINGNTLDIIDTGLNGRAIVEKGIKLEEGKYSFDCTFRNNNTDADTTDVINFFDFEVAESIMTSDFGADYSNLYISSFPVVGKTLLFTRDSEDGTIYYFKGADNEEFTYIQEPYYMYSGGVDMTAGVGQSIFNLNNSYTIFYMQNGLVRIGFNRFNGELYISKYDIHSRQYINVARLQCSDKDFIVANYSDDKIQIVAGTTVYTMYRGHPYIVINHPNEDILFETTWNSVFADGLNDEFFDYPLFFDLLNHDNLLPLLNLDDLIALDVENTSISSVPTLTLSEPSDTYIDEEIIFDVDGEVSNIADHIPIQFRTYSGNHGEYSWGLEVDNSIPKFFTLNSPTHDMNTGDTAPLVATLQDYEGNGIPNMTVSFYEKFNAYDVDLESNHRNILKDGTATLSATLRDIDDGSIVRRSGRIISFYKVYDDVVPTGLELSASSNIASKYHNDTITVTATVTDTLDEAVSGANVVFKNGATVLGNSVTNDNGVATYTYTANGDGDVTITAECESLSDTVSIEDCIYWSDSEVSYQSSYNSGDHSIKLDDNFTTQLPTNCLISFDGKSNISGSRLQLSSKANSYSTTSNYGVGFHRDNTNTNCYYRTTTSNTFGTPISSDTDYHSFKFIKTGTSVEAFLDNVSQGTETFTWIDQYSDYTWIWWVWRSGTIYGKNLKIKDMGDNV